MAVKYDKNILKKIVQIILPIWFTFVLFALSIFFILVPSLKTNMMDQKKQTIKLLIDHTYSLLSGYEDQVRQGLMTRENAQEKAIAQIRDIRYGTDGKDYYWINDMTPVMIMHPYLPDLEGRDISMFADPNGKRMFMEAVRLVTENGSGYVDYLWEDKDNPDKRVPKISYVKGFAPWQWVLGTGIYTKDVESEISTILGRLTGVLILILLVILCISFYLTFQTFGIEDERHRSVTQLKKSERLHRRFIDNAPIGMYTLNLKGEFTYANKKLTQITGYKIKDWMNQSFSPIVHPDDLEIAFTKIKNRLAGKGSSEPYEIRIFNSNQDIIWLKITSSSIYEGSGSNVPALVGMQSFVEDITDVKHAEDINRTLFAISNAVNATNSLPDLYEQIHELLGEVFDVTNFFIVLVDTTERTLHFPYYVDTRDKDFSAIENFDAEDSLSGLVVTRKKPLLLKRAQLEKRAEQNGVWGPVPKVWMGVPLIIKDEVIGVIAVQSYTDEERYTEHDLQILTAVSDQVALAIERKQGEDKIRNLSQFRESIIENADIWLNVLDERGNVVIWNKAAESISGYSKEEVVGHDRIWERTYPDKSYREEIMAKAIAIIQENQVMRDFETTIQRKDGHSRVISWHSNGLRDDQGNPIGSIALGRDITERRQAEKEKMNAQRIAAEHKELALVGQIAGKMAHDFNNILGIIMGNTELSLIECTDPEMIKTLELIVEQTIKGRNLTKNLIAFAKSQEPKQDYFKIHEKIDFVLGLMKKDLEEIEIIREDQPDTPELLADPGMIEHALINLIQNAVHATSLTPDPVITIRTYAGNEQIGFDIEDNGCGIPKEYMDSIFTPSFTLKGNQDINGAYKSGIKGSGYGMSNVSKYIKLHKGEIRMESEPDVKTRVRVSLPVIKKELTPKEKIAIRNEQLETGKRILLVEDETSISNVQYRLLTGDPLCHQVDIAPNGQTAMTLFKANAYDLVSLDYILPGKINGMDIYKFIRSEDKRIPILFISGNIEFLESLNTLKQGDPFVDHRSKPCQNKEYLSAINTLLRHDS